MNESGVGTRANEGLVVIFWDRVDSTIIGYCGADQVEWLRQRLTEFAALIDWRTAQYTTDYPLGAELGLPLPAGPSGEPALEFLLRMNLDEDLPEEARLLWEPDFLAWLREGVDHAVRVLPADGSPIVLHDNPETLRHWNAVLFNLRVAYAVTWVPEVLLHDELPEPPADLRPRYDHARWLWEAVHSLANFADA